MDRIARRAALRKLAAGTPAPRLPFFGSTSAVPSAREQVVDMHATIPAAPQSTLRMESLDGFRAGTSLEIPSTSSESIIPITVMLGARRRWSIASSMASLRRRW